jgi:hypothetical protein
MHSFPGMLNEEQRILPVRRTGENRVDRGGGLDDSGSYPLPPRRRNLLGFSRGRLAPLRCLERGRRFAIIAQMASVGQIPSSTGTMVSSFDRDSAKACFHHVGRRFDPPRREIRFQKLSGQGHTLGFFRGLQCMAQTENVQTPFVPLLHPVPGQPANQVRVHVHGYAAPPSGSGTDWAAR